MKKFFIFSGRALTILVLLALAAEGIARFFLPAPTIQKLPVLEFVADPVCGYKLVPGQDGYILHELSHINKWGFRDKDWTVEKPEGTIRVAVMGASFPFGHGVADGETFPRVLEKMLNEQAPAGKRYEVLNFAVPGYDAGQAVCRLREDAIKFKPDIVILGFNMLNLFYIDNYDFYPELFRKQKAEFSRFRWEFLNLCRRSSLLQYLWDTIKYKMGIRGPDEVGDVIDAYVRGGADPRTGPKADGWKVVGEKLRDFSGLARENGFKPYLLVIPDYREIFEKNPSRVYMDYLGKTSSGFGVEPLFLIDYLKKSGKKPLDYMIAYDFHFKESGHEMVARYLTEAIRREEKT